MNLLANKKCTVCERGTLPLTSTQIENQLKHIPKWQVAADGKSIMRTFTFKGFYKTMAFVNAVAWIANTEGHHPDMEVSYNRCVIHFTTHAIDNLTDNDFICAAKIDKLIDEN